MSSFWTARLKPAQPLTYSVIKLAPHAGSMLDEAADQDWSDMTSRRHGFRQG